MSLRPRFVVCVALVSSWLCASVEMASSQGGTDGSDRPQGKPELVVFRDWRFDRWNDREGWTMPPRLTGAVFGGSMWLTMRGPNGETELGAIGKQMHTEAPVRMDSPCGLNIPADRAGKVRIRLLNRSPETDGLVWWRTTDAPDRDQGPVRFTMKPYAAGWQEVVCHMDDHWRGRIDRIGLCPGMMCRRGDIWIDRIAITDGPRRAPPPRPDVASVEVVPRIQLPGVSQADLADAFKVLDECLITNVPVAGFECPVMGPGGAYGENWWQLDSSLALAGAKWANQAFAEGVIRGFLGVQSQNPDGRIDLWGGAPARGNVADLSSLPRYFEAAYDVARRSDNADFREAAYRSMRAYLDWWLSSVKHDAKTGLITAIAEETFGEATAKPQTLAPMDLNVAVIVGCRNVAELARRLGHADDAARYGRRLVELRTAIERHSWDEARQVYCGYDVVAGKRLPRLLCTTFDAFRMGALRPERQSALLAKLTDPALFNWGRVGLTSVARTDSSYVEAVGPYDGRAWYGDIWTLRNLTVVAGLEEIGRHDLAAELAWRTVRIFNRRWTEYLKPSDGSGQGVARYGWSASQYIQAIVEHLFGVDFDRMESRLRVFPHVPKELAGESLELDRLILPPGRATRLRVRLEPSGNGGHRVLLGVTGPIPAKTTEVWRAVAAGAPTPEAIDMATGKQLPLISDETLPGAVGVRIPTKPVMEVLWSR